MKFLKKVVNGFIGFICFLINIFLAMNMYLSTDVGGLNLSGILAFLFWLGTMVVFIIISPKISSVVAFIVYMIVWKALGIHNDSWTTMIIIFILLMIGYFYMKKRENINDDVSKAARQGIIKCPKCGSSSVEFIQPGQKWVDTAGHYKCMACGKEFKPSR